MKMKASKKEFVVEGETADLVKIRYLNERTVFEVSPKDLEASSDWKPNPDLARVNESTLDDYAEAMAIAMNGWIPHP
ncbi:MAG TPA: hypothetical protein VE485_11450 [Mycobacterium sp.]|jgi:hypothetical protein|nr:hypothetical protein [Mycobacterium sp.]